MSKPPFLSSDPIQKKADLLAYLRDLPVPKTRIQRIRDGLITRGLYFSQTRHSRLFDRIPESCTIVITGLEHAGKTTLLSRFLTRSTTVVSEVLKLTPILGLNLEIVNYGNVRFIAFEIGGCSPEIYHDAQHQLCRNADAMIFLVDIADTDRLIEARELLRGSALCEQKGARVGVPVLIMGTKNDLANARDTAEVAKVMHLNSDLEERHPWHFVSTSLKTGKGVYQGLEWLSSKIKHGNAGGKPPTMIEKSSTVDSKD